MVQLPISNPRDVGVKFIEHKIRSLLRVVLRLPEPADGHVVVASTQAYKQAEVKSKEEVTAGSNEARFRRRSTFKVTSTSERCTEVNAMTCVQEHDTHP